MGGIGGRGGIKMASASTPSAMDSVEPVSNTSFSPHSTDSSGRMVSSGIVMIASVYSDKTHLKKLIMMMIIIILLLGTYLPMNKSQETTDFSGHQKLTYAMKLRPEK